MWKRPEDTNKPESLQPHPTPAPPPAAAPPPPPMTAAAPPPAASQQPKERASIGSSISILGDLSGDEDLVVYGRVDGKVDLAQHAVTIGKSGRVKADVFGKTISVEGEVHGNLYAGEQIVLRKSGSVHGNLTAPRVTLEDGCKFKGSIDMDPQSADRARAAHARASEPKAVAQPAAAAAVRVQ